MRGVFHYVYSLPQFQDTLLSLWTGYNSFTSDFRGNSILTANGFAGPS